MTVSSEVARVVHTANGTATFFSYAPMDGVTSGNLKVYLFDPTTGTLTLQTLGTDYTFGSGGVTFTAAPPSGRRVILLRQVELLQPDVYKTNAPFPAAVTEKRLDEIVKGLQQINDVVQNRSIILPPGDAGFSSNVLPAVENRKGGVLYFNATTGDPETKQLADTIVAVSPWAMSFLTQSSVEEGLDNIGVVYKAGDTMTGPLTVPNATAGGHALNRDTGDGRYLQLTGGTVTGAVSVPNATAGGHALNRNTGDARYAQLAAANTFTKPNTFNDFITLHADPTAAMHAVTKAYADRSGPGGSTGPIFTPSGTTYDVTGIPSWANVIEVFFVNNTTAAGVNQRVRLGTNNGFVTSGYRSANGTRTGEISDNTCFISFYLDTNPITGLMRIVRAEGSRWVQVHLGHTSASYLTGGGGSVDIGGPLTQIRIFIASSNYTGGVFSLRWTA